MIIGISGLAGSGKDTAADLLVRDHGFVKVVFATPIKEFCEWAFDFSHEQLWGPSSARNAEDFRYRILRNWRAARSRFDERALSWLNEIGLGEKSLPAFGRWFNDLQVRSVVHGLPFSPRVALQTLGTEFGRTQDPDVWVKVALQDSDLNKVLPDVRFKNEMAGIKQAGGHLIRMKRGEGLVGTEAAHRSEAEQLEMPDSYFSVVIHNEAISLDELAAEVSRVYRSLC